MNIAIASTNLNTNLSSSIEINGKRLHGVTAIIIEAGQMTLVKVELNKLNDQGRFYLDEETGEFAKQEFTLVCDRLEISGHAIGFEQGTDVSELPQELRTAKGE